jgi:hypothetical protein
MFFILSKTLGSFAVPSNIAATLATFGERRSREAKFLAERRKQLTAHVLRPGFETPD